VKASHIDRQSSLSPLVPLQKATSKLNTTVLARDKNMPKRTLSDDNNNSRSKAVTKPSNKKLKCPETVPDILKELRRKFEALNVFCAFCDARLTTSITLQSLQKAVSNLKLDDLAAINVIIPNFIKFNPISNDIMEIEFGRPVSKATSKQKHTQALGNRGDDWVRGFVNKDSMPVKPNAVKKMIEQQNNLFIKSMNKFILDCEKKVTLLCKRMKRF
jgi:DEAD/DEAH box helicase domain-containing protein